MANDRISITTESGLRVEAITPVIVSASRATDIPAFHAEWFFNRLAAGYCVWHNPFNRKPVYVSFSKTKVIVFWTKNPTPIIPFLPELDRRGIHYYFHFTLNDYDNERFEPNIPILDERIATFKKLSDIIGKEKIIWRFDPLIISPLTTPRSLLSRIWKIGNRIKGYTDKLVFSFVDVKGYRKVQQKLINETDIYTKDTVLIAEPSSIQRMEIIDGLVKLREIWQNEGWNLRMATCAENMKLEHVEIEHNSCIDGALMERLWPEDKDLVYYLHTGLLPETDLFGSIPPIPAKRKDLKDKGQRKDCLCIKSKDIGSYNTCHHLCAYCYANTSRDSVARNLMQNSDCGESL